MIVTLSPQKIKTFQTQILTWYKTHKRDLPWRHTRDPYKILISEVMSQQTQISRVVPKYHEWLQAFPTLEDLAKGSVRDVLQHWSGLGYNRRALYLKKCAEELVKCFQKTQKSRKSDNLRFRNSESPSFPSSLKSLWPQTEEELMKLPGIGKYTARAILCFAFNKQVAVVDTNVKKVILTDFLFRHSGLSRIPSSSGKDSGVASCLPADTAFPRMTEKEIESIAGQLLPKGRAYEWNQALMDYASLMLKKEKIVIPKQSRFKDSDRYYRGKIIRYLLSHLHTTENELLEWFVTQHIVIDRNRLISILAGLEKDRILIKKGNNLFITE